jgi:hypothetical protein
MEAGGNCYTVAFVGTVLVFNSQVCTQINDILVSDGAMMLTTSQQVLAESVTETLRLILVEPDLPAPAW